MDDQSTYNISDVSKMTQLSERTIRNYIKDGRLPGTKTDGVWTFSSEDIETFYRDDFIKQSINIKNNAVVNDFINDNKKKVATLCTIYDHPIANKREARLFSEALIERVNAQELGIQKMTYYFDEINKMIRVILVGQKDIIAHLLEEID